MLFDIISTTVFVLYIIFLLYKSKVNPAFLFCIIICYSIITKQISITYLNNVNEHIIESGIVSSRSNANFWYIIYHFTFITSIFLSSYILEKRKHKKIYFYNTKSIQIVLIIIGLVVCLYFVNSIVSPNAIFTPGIDRFNYWDSAKLDILNKTFGNLIGFINTCAILCYCLSKSKNIKFFCIVMIIMQQLILISNGQKFHGLLITLLPAFSIMMIYQIVHKEKVIQNKLILSITLIILSILIFGINDILYKRKISNNKISPIAYRIFVLQGGYLWSVFNIYENTKPDRNILYDGKIGIKESVMPKALQERYNEKGVDLASGLSGIGYIAFGKFNNIYFMFLSGALIGIIFYICTLVIKYKLVFSSIPIYYVVTLTSYIYTGSVFLNFISPLLIIGVITIFIEYNRCTHAR